MDPTGEIQKQRIDTWLWHARIAKSRTLAGTLASGGHIRINREKTRKASQSVKLDDTLTLFWGGRVRIVRVAGFAEKRGPAALAETLYDDLSPPVPKKEKAIKVVPAQREKGAGRPTKKERRAIDRFNDPPQ